MDMPTQQNNELIQQNNELTKKKEKKEIDYNKFNIRKLTSLLNEAEKQKVKLNAEIVKNKKRVEKIDERMTLIVGAMAKKTNNEQYK